MSTGQQQVPWGKILATAGPYPIEAFGFVREGLTYTAQQIHGNGIDDLPEMDRHVTGQQLCLGLRDFAIDRYGLLAPVVLEHWRIRRTDDFGRIVFSMIDAGLMSSTPEDTMEAFRGVFDFHEAFAPDELAAQLS